MDYGFIKDFRQLVKDVAEINQQLVKDVAEIKLSLATLATQSDDRAGMKAVTADMKARGEGLQQAVDSAKAAGGV